MYTFKLFPFSVFACNYDASKLQVICEPKLFVIYFHQIQAVLTEQVIMMVM